MADSLMKQLAKAEGYCCVYAWVRSWKGTAHEARRIGVHARTIRKYKSQFQTGKIYCEFCDDCKFASGKED